MADSTPAQNLWPSGSTPDAKGVRTALEGVRTNSNTRLCKCGCGASLDGKRTDADFLTPGHRRKKAREEFYVFLDDFAPGWVKAWEALGHTIQREEQ